MNPYRSAAPPVPGSKLEFVLTPEWPGHNLGTPLTGRVATVKAILPPNHYDHDELGPPSVAYDVQLDDTGERLYGVHPSWFTFLCCAACGYPSPTYDPDIQLCRKCQRIESDFEAETDEEVYECDECQRVTPDITIDDDTGLCTECADKGPAPAVTIEGTGDDPWVDF